ncbi:MAG: META domain-containing protein [Alphaproteobacteria bacterium]|nr:META domain-containing protein [Alphaproteobacteria bacterium]
MNLKYFALAGAMAALAACDNSTPQQNPDALKGNNYIAQQDGVNIALAFDPNDMTVHGQIVNLYNGPYIADGEKIKFGNLATTMMMGPQNAMEVEQAFLQFMNTADTYEISDSKLTIKNADDQEIVFDQVAEIPTPVNE